MIDRYTKIVLTVIAVSLAALALQGFTPHAVAAGLEGCGAVAYRPCHVSIADDVLTVVNKRDPPRREEPREPACGSRQNPCYVRGGGNRTFPTVSEPVEVQIVGGK